MKKKNYLQLKYSLDEDVNGVLTGLSSLNISSKLYYNLMDADNCLLWISDQTNSIAIGQCSLIRSIETKIKLKNIFRRRRFRWVLFIGNMVTTFWARKMTTDFRRKWTRNVFIYMRDKRHDTWRQKLNTINRRHILSIKGIRYSKKKSTLYYGNDVERCRIDVGAPMLVYTSKSFA